MQYWESEPGDPKMLDYLIIDYIQTQKEEKMTKTYTDITPEMLSKAKIELQKSNALLVINGKDFNGEQGEVQGHTWVEIHWAFSYMYDMKKNELTVSPEGHEDQIFKKLDDLINSYKGAQV